MKTRTAIIIGFVLFMAALATVGVSTERWRRPTKQLWAKVTVGLSRDEVIRILGEPEKAYTVAAAPRNYYIPGYGRRERPISDEVLIYRAADMVLYVWLDQNGKVEETFRGVS